MKKRFWTPTEKQLFEEGLEKYGRDWEKVVAHIGTRDMCSVRSHAQIHFAHLMMKGEPLPPKVCFGEGGGGVTCGAHGRGTRRWPRAGKATQCLAKSC